MSRARKSKAEMNGNSLGVVSVEAGASAERSAGERSEPQRAAVLARPFSAATNVRRDQLDSVLLPEALVEPVRVVRLVADEVLGEFVEKALPQDFFDQLGFMRRSTSNPHGDRKTMALRNCHDLGPFAAAC